MKALDLVKKRFVKVDKNDSVSHLLGSLKSADERAALVFDSKKFFGVSDLHLLFKTKIDTVHFKVSKVTKKPPVLNGNESVKEVARLFFTSNLHILPVIKKNVVVGIIKDIYLIQLLKKDNSLANKKISDLMSLDLICLKQSDKLGSALSLMREKKVSRIPICDKSGVVSMISHSDLIDLLLSSQYKSERRGRGSPTMSGNRTIRAFSPEKDDLNAFPLKSLSNPVISLSSDVSVKVVVSELVNDNINSVLFVDDDQPVGIITVRDLLKLFLKDLVTF